jgi:flavorubredoxin
MIAEVFRSKSILVGSSTISNGILHSVAGFVNMMKEMRFKKKKAASFGCYGWSGESTKILSELLREAGSTS